MQVHEANISQKYTYICSKNHYTNKLSDQLAVKLDIHMKNTDPTIALNILLSLSKILLRKLNAAFLRRVWNGCRSMSTKTLEILASLLIPNRCLKVSLKATLAFRIDSHL